MAEGRLNSGPIFRIIRLADVSCSPRLVKCHQACRSRVFCRNAIVI
jgi:hypothetical protein